MKLFIICSILLMTVCAAPDRHSGIHGQGYGNYQDGNFQTGHPNRRHENIGGYSGAHHNVGGNFHPTSNHGSPDRFGNYHAGGYANGYNQHGFGNTGHYPSSGVGFQNNQGIGRPGYPNSGGTFHHGGLAGSQGAGRHGNIGGYPGTHHGGYQTHYY